jgi:TrpR-related protein YerC/YecD
MTQDEAQRLYAALRCLRTDDEVQAFLGDLCTPREIDDLSQRLQVATLLSQGHSYNDVIHATGASSTTVSRVSRCLKGERGGYRTVLERLDGKDPQA